MVPKLKWDRVSSIEGFRCNKLISTEYAEFRVGRDGEPMAVKTKLGWMLMGGSKCNKWEDSCNFLCNNSSSTIVQNVQNFCTLDIYGTLPKLSSELLPPCEKRSLNILEETTTIKDNLVETGLL